MQTTFMNEENPHPSKRVHVRNLSLDDIRYPFLQDNGAYLQQSNKSHILELSSPPCDLLDRMYQWMETLPLKLSFTIAVELDLI